MLMRQEMSTGSPSAENRSQILDRLFPDDVPKLWCPALTHYDPVGKIDGKRIAAHLRHLSENVRAFLIPGSTGDGWELTDNEIRQLLEIALEQAQQLKLHLLIGALKPAPEAALRMIWDTIEWIKSRTGESDFGKSLAKARVCGFALCAPRGKDVSQGEMERAFEGVLKTGVPIALYQLPQVTQNEIGEELASSLAMRFENFIMFKDSSGADRVVSCGKELGGVFKVRGAEGNYARWLKASDACYDGFLLSAANCFAKELRTMISDLAEGRVEAAEKISKQLTETIEAVFRLVSTFPDGNAYANANKAIDHFFAYGPEAATISPPRLHAGSFLPAEMITGTGKILERYGLMPKIGYYRMVE
jgi:dihydrodipicolinate synthase/N-acetylneuraminate lyase